MTPFFHQNRRRPRLPTAVGAAAVSRHHPSINYPVVFRFRGGGAPSRSPLVPPRSTVVSPYIWPETLDHPEGSSFPFQAPYDSLETVKYAERRLLETLQALLIDAKAERTLNPRGKFELILGKVRELILDEIRELILDKVGEVEQLTVALEIYQQLLIERIESSRTQNSQKEMPHFSSKLDNETQEMSYEIKTFRAQVQERRLFRMSYEFKTFRAQVQELHRFFTCVKEEHAVGIEEDVKKLVQILGEKGYFSFSQLSIFFQWLPMWRLYTYRPQTEECVNSQLWRIGESTVALLLIEMVESSCTQNAQEEMLHFWSKLVEESKEMSLCERVQKWYRLAPCVKEEHIMGMEEDVKRLEIILNEEKKYLPFRAVVIVEGIVNMVKKMAIKLTLADEMRFLHLLFPTSPTVAGIRNAREEMLHFSSKLDDETQEMSYDFRTLRAQVQERRRLVVDMVEKLVRELIIDEEKKCLPIAAVVGLEKIEKLTVALAIYQRLIIERVESSHTRVVSVRMQNVREEMLHFLSKGGTCGSNKHRVSRCVKEEHAVGMDEDVKKLVREFILDEEKKQLSIAAVVGMGGIGKSTLAREIYNHLDILARFDCLAWVEVSSESAPEETIKQLILQMLISDQEKQMLCEQIHTTELSIQLDTQGMIKKLLQRMLYKLLEGKTYFIVLDNMWEKEHLEFLREAFPKEQEKASRLLLTSRTPNILEDAQYIHEMKILDPNKSWQLFLKTVFASDRDRMKCPSHLEKIGREILKKCNGLPLAIKVVGSQLAIKKQSESVWENFIESIDLSAISAELESSYVKLPLKLKSCFLRLGFFKEGTTIRAEKLVQIWIAGGIVSQEDEGKKQTNEEIARRNLDELISQYMVQVKDMTRDNRVKNCHVNDNLHRLSVAKAEKDIWFDVLKKDGNYRSSHKPRHRAICCSREKFNYSMNQDIHLHSLFFRGGGNLDASPCYWESFELLKILDLEGFGLKSLPEMIGTATRLRYLGLRNNFIQELPRSLGDLEKLEVLDIALNFTVEVPDIIWEMDSLRHLYMSDIICKEPLRIDALKHLQTLTYISVDNWIYNLWGLQKMKSLRKLGIEELDETSDISKLFASLAKLKNLDCLILRGFRFRSIPSLNELGILRRLTQLKLDGLLTKLPSANNFPPNIAYLTLVNSSLDEDPMPQLGKLSNLLDLKLRNAFTGEQMVISHRKFAKLQVLCIGELRHLRNLQVAEGAMPMLKRLEISSCPYLETLPKKIGLMTNLKELKMVTTKKIAAKIRESGFISKIGDADIQP